MVKRMEELGIGRPSTYASILQVLQDAIDQESQNHQRDRSRVDEGKQREHPQSGPDAADSDDPSAPVQIRQVAGMRGIEEAYEPQPGVYPFD